MIPSAPGAGRQAAGSEPDITSAEPPLARVLEAVLMVADEPVAVHELAQVAERPRTDVEAELVRLAREYAAEGRGFELREVGGGWRLYSSADCAAYVERFVVDANPPRLSQAGLETLAIIAYRQPVSRQAIAAIRGVNVDGVVRTLLARGLIEEAVQAGESGAVLYRTNQYFLERLGLSSLSELPPLAPYLPTDLSGLEDDA